MKIKVNDFNYNVYTYKGDIKENHLSLYIEMDGAPLNIEGYIKENAVKIKEIYVEYELDAFFSGLTEEELNEAVNKANKHKEEIERIIWDQVKLRLIFNKNVFETYNKEFEKWAEFVKGLE